MAALFLASISSSFLAPSFLIQKPGEKLFAYYLSYRDLFKIMHHNIVVLEDSPRHCDITIIFVDL